MAKELVNIRRFSIRLACACVDISESGYRYRAKHSTENALIADWLLRLTTRISVGILANALCIYETLKVSVGIINACIAFIEN